MLKGIVILPAERPRQSMFDGDEQPFARHALVDLAQDVEIPVVVIPETSRSMAAAGRSRRLHGRRFRGRRQIDPGPGLQQVAHRHAALGRRQLGIILDADLLERRVEPDSSLGCGHPIERAHQRFADRRDSRRLRDRAFRQDDVLAVGDDEGAHAELFGLAAERGQALGLPARSRYGGLSERRHRLRRQHAAGE